MDETMSANPAKGSATAGMLNVAQGSGSAALEGRRVVIVGGGVSGLFAALTLLEEGQALGRFLISAVIF